MNALRHWPEYLMEAAVWAFYDLGECSNSDSGASSFTNRQAITDAMFRRFVIGVAMV